MYVCMYVKHAFWLNSGDNDLSDNLHLTDLSTHEIKESLDQFYLR